MKKKKLWLSICSLALCVAASVVGMVAFAADSGKKPGDAFEYTETTPLKYKTYVSESGSARKGLLLYGYDNGATASFKGSLSGVFETEMKAVSSIGSAELRRYSLRFTDTATKQVFAVEISEGSTSYCNVSVGGDKAGVAYYKDNKAYGYTSESNAEGIYTFFSSGAVSVKFDPTTKIVSVHGEHESYKTVWNFGEKYNDGKKFDHELSSFDNYTVEIAFDEIKSAGKGELLVYTFGGISFDSREIKNALRVNVAVKTKAIVGEKYALPKATVENVLEGKIDATATVNVYDENGGAVNDGKYEFTPEKAGNYYAYYSYKDGENEASQYCLIEAIDRENVMYSFDYAEKLEVPETVGLHSKVYLPKAKANCSLGVSALPADAVVTVYKNGTAVTGFENIEGGKYFSFDEAGSYTITYSAPVYGDFVKEEINVEVSASVAGVVSDEKVASLDVLDYGSRLSLEPTKVYLGGRELTATSTVKFPSGKTASARDAYLDELGVYTLEETWEGGSREIEFTVSETYSDLFTGTKAGFGELAYDNSRLGQTLEVGETPLVYNKLINLTDNKFDETLEDKTQNVPLLEMVIQPSKSGQKDMTGLFIEFVDAHDSSNFISIRVKYQDYDRNKNRIRTKATGQTWIGYYYNYRNSGMEVHDAQSHDDGGFIGNGTFLQSLNGMKFDESIIRFYYDYEKCSLYSKPDHLTSEDNSVVPWLVRDYDTTDETMSAGQNPWRGFTNGEVYMRIYAAGLSGTAKIGLLNVDGDVLDEKHVEDTEAPTITVDLPSGGEVPYALVNKPYEIFPFTAKDAYTGASVSDPEVYFGKTQIAVTNGKFTPDAEGIYTIVYKAKDYYGNESVKKVEVEARAELDKIRVDFASELPSSADYGKKITLPEVSVSGGAGGYKTNVAVTCNGDEVPVEYGTFRCLKEGRYLVKFNVTDYVGTSANVTKTIIITRSDKPVIDEDEIMLPPEFFIYESYDLGEYAARVYGTSGSEEIKSEVEVYADGVKLDVADGIFTPDESLAGKTVTVKYVFKKSDDCVSVYETEVGVADPMIGYSGFMKNYFIAGGDAEPTCGAEGLTFGIPTGGSGTIAFARKIDARYAKFYFVIKGEKFAKGFDTFKVTLRDSENFATTLTVSIENISSVYWARVAGGERAAFTVEPNGNFSIVYDYENKRFVDSYGYSLGEITKCDNGRPFDGFGSGFVYASFEATGATENQIVLLQLANQIINDTSYDFIQPIITVNGYVSGNFAMGSTVTLPTATAYDVLSSCGKVKVTVTCGKDTILYNKDASEVQSFAINQYGVYQIIYSVEAEDMGGLAKVTRFVYCYDTVKPELEFDGSILSTIRSGDTIKLPSYTIKDNGDVSKATVTIYVCTPDGVMHTVSGGNVKLTGAGEYIVYYQVTDENGNMSTYTFRISVE